MHVLHEHEDPDAVIGQRLLKTLKGGDRSRLLDRIALDAFICQNAFVGREPSSDCEWLERSGAVIEIS